MHKAKTIHVRARPEKPSPQPLLTPTLFEHKGLKKSPKQISCSKHILHQQAGAPARAHPRATARNARAKGTRLGVHNVAAPQSCSTSEADDRGLRRLCSVDRTTRRWPGETKHSTAYEYARSAATCDATATTEAAAHLRRACSCGRVPLACSHRRGRPTIIRVKS